MTAHFSGVLRQILSICTVFMTLQIQNGWAGTPVRHVIWDKTPVPLILKIDIEKRIDFPAPLATVDMPAPLQAPVSTLIFTGNTLYWTAHKSWPRTRLIATTTDGTVYLIDATASAETGNAHPLIIVPSAPSTSESNEDSNPHYDAIDLVRYAAQHLYGPKRLVKPLPGVTRIPVRQKWLPLIRGAMLDARPIAQWHDLHDGLYVTAVAIHNKTDRIVTLDPLAIRGRWLFAAPHQHSVTAQGSLGDSTAWYLVSSAPFDTLTQRLQSEKQDKSGEVISP